MAQRRRKGRAKEGREGRPEGRDDYRIAVGMKPIAGDIYTVVAGHGEKSLKPHRIERLLRKRT